MNPLKIEAETQIRLITANNESVFVTSGLSTIYQYSLHNFNLIHRYKDKDDDFPYPIEQMECTSDKLMYLRSSGAFFVWSIKSPFPKLLHRLEIPKVKCTSFSIGANSLGGELTTIFCVYEDGSLVAWGIGKNGLLKTTISRNPQKEYCVPFEKGSLYCTKNQLVLEMGTQPNLVLVEFKESNSQFKKRICVDEKIIYFWETQDTMLRIDTSNHEYKYYKVNDCPICFWEGYIFLSNNKNTIHQCTYSGERIKRFDYHSSKVTCLHINNNTMFWGNEDGDVYMYDLNVYEEDSDTWSAISIDGSSVVSVPSVKHCSNKGILHLESYTEEDDPIVVYLMDSNLKYKNAVCFTQDEFRAFIQSDLDKAFPDHIMAIYSKPRYPDSTGIGSHPTGRIVVKLPINNVYVTFGSARKLSGKERVWYAVPLYGGKKRRVGNIRGLFGVSMNHGQIPGEIIYKLFTKIEDSVDGLESDSDYPVNISDAKQPLNEVMEIPDDNINPIIKKLLKDIE